MNCHSAFCICSIANKLAEKKILIIEARGKLFIIVAATYRLLCFKRHKECIAFPETPYRKATYNTLNTIPKRTKVSFESNLMQQL